MNIEQSEESIECIDQSEAHIDPLEESIECINQSEESIVLTNQRPAHLGPRAELTVPE